MCGVLECMPAFGARPFSRTASMDQDVNEIWLALIL
jgi:hypothetical protein